MAEPADDGRVSREAHDRMTRERDDLRSEIAALKSQVHDFGRREALSRAIDPDGNLSHREVAETAEFMLPHFRDVEVDKIPEMLRQDRFARFIPNGTGRQAPPPEQNEETDDPDVPVASPGFGGPNPGSGGVKPEGTKIVPGSPEFQRLVASNDREAIESADIDWTPVSS